MSDCKPLEAEQNKTRTSCCAPRMERSERVAPAPAIIPSMGKQSVTDMTSLPGGTFLMGTDYPLGFAADGEGPVRAVTLPPFQIDTYPVTNTSFAQFIQATGYRTDAERFGWSFVFWSHIPPERFDEVVEDTAAATPWWCKVPGARWNAPEGPGSGVAERANFPVVHVSWNDAQAYAQWAGKVLPTEAQWEYAARGGLEQKLYPWGDELTPGGQHLCNIWQGQFPLDDIAEDGHAGTCAVDAFPANGYGLYSITGNAWEWCSDWFTTNHQSDVLQHSSGHTSDLLRVMKGGSFLCHESYCNRYRVGARTSNTMDSSASNIGFRCALKILIRAGMSFGDKFEID